MPSPIRRLANHGFPSMSVFCEAPDLWAFDVKIIKESLSLPPSSTSLGELLTERQIFERSLSDGMAKEIQLSVIDRIQEFVFYLHLSWNHFLSDPVHIWEYQSKERSVSRECVFCKSYSSVDFLLTFSELTIAL